MQPINMFMCSALNNFRSVSFKNKSTTEIRVYLIISLFSKEEVELTKAAQKTSVFDRARNISETSRVFAMRNQPQKS